MPAHKRRRLLFLGHNLPWPPDTGPRVRTYHILRELAADFDIFGLCFLRHTPARLTPAERIRSLEPLGRFEAFPLAMEAGSWHRLWTYLKGLLPDRVYTKGYYADRTYRTRLTEALSDNHWDLILVDSLDLVGYFDLLPMERVVLGHHDVESEQLTRLARAEPQAWKRWYALRQARTLKKLEAQWNARAAANLVVSGRDQKVFETHAAGRYWVVPNGVDTTFFAPAEQAESGCVFSGSAAWKPNLDAMQYYCAEIASRFPRPVVTRWVGAVRDRDWNALPSACHLERVGYVDDVRPWIRRAACYVAPLKVGTGTRIKILEAWGMGKAVVSTSLACEGLEAHDGQNILIRDDPAGFADAVMRVLDDRDLRSALGRAASDTARRLYDWRLIGQELAGRLTTLAAREPGRPPEDPGAAQTWSTPAEAPETSGSQ